MLLWASVLLVECKQFSLSGSEGSQGKDQHPDLKSPARRTVRSVPGDHSQNASFIRFDSIKKRRLARYRKCWSIAIFNAIAEWMFLPTISLAAVGASVSRMQQIPTQSLHSIAIRVAASRQGTTHALHASTARITCYSLYTPWWSFNNHEKQGDDETW